MKKIILSILTFFIIGISQSFALEDGTYHHSTAGYVVISGQNIKKYNASDTLLMSKNIPDTMSDVSALILNNANGGDLSIVYGFSGGMRVNFGNVFTGEPITGTDLYSNGTLACIPINVGSCYGLSNTSYWYGTRTGSLGELNGKIFWNGELIHSGGTPMTCVDKTQTVSENYQLVQTLPSLDYTEYNSTGSYLVNYYNEGDFAMILENYKTVIEQDYSDWTFGSEPLNIKPKVTQLVGFGPSLSLVYDTSSGGLLPQYFSLVSDVPFSTVFVYPDGTEEEYNGQSGVSRELLKPFNQVIVKFKPSIKSYITGFNVSNLVISYIEKNIVTVPVCETDDGIIFVDGIITDYTSIDDVPDDVYSGDIVPLIPVSVVPGTFTPSTEYFTVDDLTFVQNDKCPFDNTAFQKFSFHYLVIIPGFNLPVGSSSVTVSSIPFVGGLFDAVTCYASIPLYLFQQDKFLLEGVPVREKNIVGKYFGIIVLFILFLLVLSTYKKY